MMVRRATGRLVVVLLVLLAGAVPVAGGPPDAPRKVSVEGGGSYTAVNSAALKAMLPWLTAHVEELRRNMGPDWWPYGFEPNRHVMETFLRYHHEQGLSKRKLRPEELFAPETMATYKI